MLLQMTKFPCFLQMTRFPSFSWPTDIPLYVNTTFSISAHLLMGTWVFSISWLLCIMLQWTPERNYLFKTMILFPLVIYPEVELLDLIVHFNCFRSLHTIFSSGYTNLHSYQQCTNISVNIVLFWRYLLDSVEWRVMPHGIWWGTTCEE